LALPIEAVRARASILFLRAWQSSKICFLILKVVERPVPKPDQ
jgi:hypothetical protein